MGATSLGGPAGAPPVSGRGLVRWVVGVAATVVVISIGLPLIGVRVFLASDNLEQYAPWKDAPPHDVRPTNKVLADTVDAVFPMRAEFRRNVYTGEFPLWTSLPSGGSPLAATPDGGQASPLNLPYLIFPIWYAPAAAKLLEMAVAVGFTFLFLRRIGLSRAPAVIGGLIYVNSGFQVVWTNWPQSHVGALIPALFWAVERAVTLRRARDAVPVSLVVAVMLLEGFPAVVAYATVAAGAYAVVRLIAQARADGTLRPHVRSPVWVAGGVALGIGLAAFQILPFAFRLESLDLSYRVFTINLPWYALETLVVPNILGTHSAETWYGPFSNYVELQCFIGATALVLALVAVFRRAARSRLAPGTWAFALGGVAVCALLLFPDTPLLDLIQSIPVLRMNWIGRLRSVLGFFLAVTAAMGFAALSSGQRETRRRQWSELVMWFAVVCASVTIGVHVWGVIRGLPVRGFVVRQSILPAVIGVAALAVAVVTLRNPRSRRPAMFLVPILIAVESLAFVLPYWPRIPRDEFYPATSAHRFLLDHMGGDRLAASDLTMYPGTTTYYGIRSVTSHTFAEPEWKDLLKAIDPGAYRFSQTYPRLPATEAVARSPVLDRLSARYFAVQPEQPVFGRMAPAPAAAGDVSLRRERPIELPVVSSGVLRGVAITLVRPVPEAERPLLVAEVVDRAGAVVGRGTRLVPPATVGPVTVPIAHRSNAAGAGQKFRLRVTGRDLVVAADRDGRPAAAPVLAAADGLRVAFAGPVVLYERLRALPRVRWASSEQYVPSAADRVRRLKAGVRPEAVLLSRPGPRASGRPAQTRVVRDRGDEMVVDVRAVGSGYLVIADDLQHGWRATVDGGDASILPADHALVAIPVGAGSHRVALSYTPRGFRLGLGATLVSLVVLIAVAAFVLAERRRARRAPGAAA